MSTGYQISEQDELHFVTFQIVRWIDIFTRRVYRDIVIDSLRFCQQHKGLEIYAFVVMSNHIHLLVRSEIGKLSDTIREFKSFMAKKILDALNIRVERTNKTNEECEMNELLFVFDRFCKAGALLLTRRSETLRRAEVSLGNYVNINIDDEITGSLDERVLADPLFMHEYGHTIDSRAFGISYLFAIGIPSIFSAGKHDGTHSQYWTETRANRRAEKYFKKHYGVNWTFPRYPLN